MQTCVWSDLIENKPNNLAKRATLVVFGRSPAICTRPYAVAVAAAIAGLVHRICVVLFICSVSFGIRNRSPHPSYLIVRHQKIEKRRTLCTVLLGFVSLWGTS